MIDERQEMATAEIKVNLADFDGKAQERRAICKELALFELAERRRMDRMGIVLDAMESDAGGDPDTEEIPASLAADPVYAALRLNFERMRERHRIYHELLQLAERLASETETS